MYDIQLPNSLIHAMQKGLYGTQTLKTVYNFPHTPQCLQLFKYKALLTLLVSHSLLEIETEG